MTEAFLNVDFWPRSCWWRRARTPRPPSHVPLVCRHRHRHHRPQDVHREKEVKNVQGWLHQVRQILPDQEQQRDGNRHWQLQLDDTDTITTRSTLSRQRRRPRFQAWAPCAGKPWQILFIRLLENERHSRKQGLDLIDLRRPLEGKPFKTIWFTPWSITVFEFILKLHSTLWEED